MIAHDMILCALYRCCDPRASRAAAASSMPRAENTCYITDDPKYYPNP